MITNVPNPNVTDNNELSGSAIAMNTLDQIPTPTDNAKDIVALQKHSGKVTGYQLSDGSLVSKEEGVTMAKNGQIRGVGVAHRNDTEYLKSLPDGTQANNLSHLPTVN